MYYYYYSTSITVPLMIKLIMTLLYEIQISLILSRWWPVKWILFIFRPRAPRSTPEIGEVDLDEMKPKRNNTFHSLLKKNMSKEKLLHVSKNIMNKTPSLADTKQAKYKSFCNSLDMCLAKKTGKPLEKQSKSSQGTKPGKTQELS